MMVAAGPSGEFMIPTTDDSARSVGTVLRRPGESTTPGGLTRDAGVRRS
jgi:hypothetical protein